MKSMRRQSSYVVTGTKSAEVDKEGDASTTMQQGHFRKLVLPRRFSTPAMGFREEEESMESRHLIEADQFVTKQYLEKKGKGRHETIYVSLYMLHMHILSFGEYGWNRIQSF